MLEGSLARNNGTIQDGDEAVEEWVQLCIFELSDRVFGLSISEVQGIMEDAEMTPVPTTPHFLSGVMNLRGNIVPIVDIRDILQLPVKPVSKESRIMILNIKQVQIGILVDAIKEVSRIEKRLIQIEPGHTGLSDGRFIANIIQYKDGFLILLDLNQLYQAIQL
jgi:purine-binding chemotaxis protein CheW